MPNWGMIGLGQAQPVTSYNQGANSAMGLYQHGMALKELAEENKALATQIPDQYEPETKMEPGKQIAPAQAPVPSAVGTGEAAPNEGMWSPGQEPTAQPGGAQGATEETPGSPAVMGPDQKVLTGRHVPVKYSTPYLKMAHDMEARAEMLANIGMGRSAF